MRIVVIFNCKAAKFNNSHVKRCKSSWTQLHYRAQMQFLKATKNSYKKIEF